MKTVHKILTIGFFSALFMGMSFYTQAQSTTITVVNNTGCDMTVNLEAWTGTACNGLKAGAQGFVPANSTVTLTWTRQGNVVAANFSDGGAVAAGTTSTSGAYLHLCQSWSNSGTSSCGSFDVVFSAPGGVQTITIQ